MARFNNPLDGVSVASPCNADWDQMMGDERARFCGQCQLNVYNLSALTRAEAELLIGRTEGRLCVRYYRRADGSILTRDCPVGLRAIRRRMSYVVRAVSSAVLTFLAGLGIYAMKWNYADRGWTTGAPVAPQARVLPVIQGEVMAPVEPMMGTWAYTPPNKEIVGRLVRVKRKPSK
jgi:hypothetical protein